MPTKHEAGFSLVELMVAMTVTLIVTGAIYGLLSGGQSAFRREPEISDRQQNIRLAMDLITRDVASAGANMPGYVQTFTVGLDGGSISTCQDNNGNPVTCPIGPSGVKTDELEILANPNGVDMEASCDYPGGSSSNVRLRAGTTGINTSSVVLIFLTDGTWTIRNINGGINYPNPGDGDCAANQPHANVQFMNGGDTTGYNLSSGLCAGTWNGTSCDTAPGNACTNTVGCKVQGVLLGEIVHYRIRNGSDGVPNLERWSSGTVSNFIAGGIPQFQVVARGIDDLQVRYTNAGGTAVDQDNAPVVVGNDLTTPITRVEVTLSARSEAKNVVGMTRPSSGPAALRGTLTSSITPRAALAVLNGPTVSRSPSPTPWF